MAETVKEFANITPFEMYRLLGVQDKWIDRIPKGPLKMNDWNDFVAQAVAWEIDDTPVEDRANIDIPKLYAIWMKASITFIEMGKIMMPPPKEPKAGPERA